VEEDHKSRSAVMLFDLEIFGPSQQRTSVLSGLLSSNNYTSFSACP